MNQVENKNKMHKESPIFHPPIQWASRRTGGLPGLWRRVINYFLLVDLSESMMGSFYWLRVGLGCMAPGGTCTWFEGLGVCSTFPTVSPCDAPRKEWFPTEHDAYRPVMSATCLVGCRQTHGAKKSVSIPLFSLDRSKMKTFCIVEIQNWCFLGTKFKTKQKSYPFESLRVRCYIDVVLL